jgi:ABC-type Mn2+/Zn2+ transport system permease subunit
MAELLLLFWPSILAGTLTAAALALTGVFLVTRQAAVQTLAVGQGAGLGVLLGVLLVQLGVHDDHMEHTIWPFFTGLFVAGGVFLLTALLSRRIPGKSGLYVAAYALLWALSQLLVGAFPATEAHSVSLYFGDIVTLGWRESFLFAALSLGALGFFALFWRRLADRAFLASLLDETPSPLDRRDLPFHLVSLGLICLSIQMLGLLFTIASLFLPTMVLSRAATSGVGRHLLQVSLCAALAAAGGFFLSLTLPFFGTSPVIVVLLLLVPLGLSAALPHFRCK